MWEAHEKSEWYRTASQMAHIANLLRFSKSARIFKTEDFFPFREEKRKAVIEADVSILKDIFLNGNDKQKAVR